MGYGRLDKYAMLCYAIYVDYILATFFIHPKGGSGQEARKEEI